MNYQQVLNLQICLLKLLRIEGQERNIIRLKIWICLKNELKDMYHIIEEHLHIHFQSQQLDMLNVKWVTFNTTHIEQLKHLKKLRIGAEREEELEVKGS